MLMVVVMVLVVLGAGYFLMQPGRETSTETLPTSEDSMMEDTVPITSGSEVNLSEQNGSGQSGMALLTEENGQVKVVINVTPGESGVAQPAHIHTGMCPDVGAVTYPLTSVVDGTSETMLDVTLDELRAQLPMGINVHKSQAEASVYTACGDLVL